MTTLFHIIPVIILTLLVGCGSHTNDSTKSSEKGTLINNGDRALVDTPRSFIKHYNSNDTNRLFVFVGEKISVDPLPSRQNAMDRSFKAKYAILKKVYGNFKEDTIEFVAYDHYGSPLFSKFKNVLLFVSADSGTYYHQKYLFNEVYKARNGRWAGTYALEDYQHAYNKRTKIKPIKIDFAEQVAFPLKIKEPDGSEIKLDYPKPYFRIGKDSAIAIYGNYVEELFELKKTGVLTSRELFKPTAEQEEDLVESWQPEKSNIPPTKDDLIFQKFWGTFTKTIIDKNFADFKKVALDTLYVCDNIVSTDDFIKRCFNELFDQEVRKRIVDKTKLECEYNHLDLFNIVTAEARTKIIKIDQHYRLRQMLVTRSTKDDNPPTIHFDFIETQNGYRLYCIDHYWFKDCCK